MIKRICQKCKVKFIGIQKICWYCREGKKWLDNLLVGIVDVFGGDWFKDERGHVWQQVGDNYFDP
jgi:hypothetical protein